MEQRRIQLPWYLSMRAGPSNFQHPPLPLEWRAQNDGNHNRVGWDYRAPGFSWSTSVQVVQVVADFFICNLPGKFIEIGVFVSSLSLFPVGVESSQQSIPNELVSHTSSSSTTNHFEVPSESPPIFILTDMELNERKEDRRVSP